MNQTWIWESSNWPNFTVDNERVIPHLTDAIRAVSPLVELSRRLTDAQRTNFECQVALDETLSTSFIEKEVLDRNSVRSSIARHLGLPNAKVGGERYETFTQVYFESIRTAQHNLTSETLKAWHEMLFIEKPVLKEITIGDYRNDEMSVVSGHFGRKEVVHFKAPCSDRNCVQQAMNQFLEWLNADHSANYIRAAIAKFWFVTIHPFDDGNGRLSRIIAERCLAEADQTDIRLYSISTEIEQRKSEYYALLEANQKGSGDLTDWITWFLDRVQDAAQKSMARLDKVLLATQFWDQHRETPFNERQRKLLIRLLETSDFEKGIARRKYKNLVSTSDATAARDLLSLVEMGVLKSEGKGRSVKYFIEPL
jgi:Fic family protein